MELQKVINIEISKPFFNILTAIQGDSARYLVFNFLDNGVPFVLTNRTVRVWGVKADNAKIYNDLTIINASNGQAELQLTTQMLAVAGILNLQLEITEGTDTLSTIPFTLNVSKNIKDDNAIESTNEFSALVNALANIDGLEANYAPRLTIVESSLSDKANKIDVTSQITQSQKVIVNYSGSLKTLIADITVNIAKNYLILDTLDTTNYGYVCTHNGTTWVQGWKYQSYGIGTNEIVDTNVRYINASKINNNILIEPFFSKFISQDQGDYLNRFDYGLDYLVNKATSSSVYEFDTLAMAFPENFRLSFTNTIDKATENGLLFGFRNLSNTSRYLWGYEPAHNAIELYNGSSFVNLDSDTNFASGDYIFELIKNGSTLNLRITGPNNYDKSFDLTDSKYGAFNIANYDSIRFQFKIPTVGNKISNIILEEYNPILKSASLKQYSQYGKIVGKNVHIYKFGGLGNDWCFVRTPKGYDPGREKPYPFVICNHGNGWTMDGTIQKASWTKRTMYVKASDADYIASPTQYNMVADDSPLLYSNPTIEALLSAGYIVCGCENYADNLYGNDNCRQACADFYQHIIKNYNVEDKCFMIGASNGAMTSLNTMYLLGGVARVKAMILQYPLTCLWKHYTNYSAHQSPIETAYGIPHGLTETEFEKATRTHDPEKVNTIVNVNGVARVKSIAMPPIKFWYSLGDTIVNANNNTLALMQVLEDSNCINESVLATGEHGDYTHFSPTDYVEWFEKYR